MVKVKGFTIVNILVGYSFNHPMVKVKVRSTLKTASWMHSFNHPMVKVKVRSTLKTASWMHSFNHPMVKVKVITRLLDIVKLGVSTTLW